MTSCHCFKILNIKYFHVFIYLFSWPFCSKMSRKYSFQLKLKPKLTLLSVCPNFKFLYWVFMYIYNKDVKGSLKLALQGVHVRVDRVEYFIVTRSLFLCWAQLWLQRAQFTKCGTFCSFSLPDRPRLSYIIYVWIFCIDCS